MPSEFNRYDCVAPNLGAREPYDMFDTAAGDQRQVGPLGTDDSVVELHLFGEINTAREETVDGEAMWCGLGSRANVTLHLTNAFSRCSGMASVVLPLRT